MRIHCRIPRQIDLALHPVEVPTYLNFVITATVHFTSRLSPDRFSVRSV